MVPPPSPDRARKGGQGWRLPSGPAVAGNWAVLKTCTPALCSPLNGVVAPGQPALVASAGELNQMPTWKVWIGPNAGLLVASGVGEECTDGAGAVFGAMANVSSLNRPTYSWWAKPSRFVSRSPWYHDTPNGALGTWMTKVSNSVLAGRPHASTVIRSTGPSCLTVTRAEAYGRQPAATMPGDRCSA